MTNFKFARSLVSAERRIVRQSLLDAVLIHAEPWSFASSSSATKDPPKAAHKEVFDQEILDEQILQSNIRRLSCAFQGSSLRDILAASDAPPPPLPTAILRGAGSWRGAAAGLCAAAGSWRDAAPAARGSFLASHAEDREDEGLPDARVAWSTLAERFKLARPASPAPESCDDARSPASCVRDASSFSINASAAGTFRRRPSMPA
jgi:hypothetical protein